MTRVGLWASTATAALVACSLVSCAPSPSTELPDGVELSVYQTRSDFSARKIEVSIVNNTELPLTVESLELDGEQFEKPAVWAKDSTTIAAGVTADLPVELGVTDCTAESLDPVVMMTYRLGEGDARTAVGHPADSLDRLGELFADDCFVEAVRPTAIFTADSELRIVDVAGQSVALIDIAIVPQGDGAIRIDAVGNTTLLDFVDLESGVPGSPVPIGLDVAGNSAPQTLTLGVVPSRCDPHAIAEDKRGTIVPLEITLDDGSTGRVYVPTADAVKSALYDFVSEVCGN